MTCFDSCILDNCAKGVLMKSIIVFRCRGSGGSIYLTKQNTAATEMRERDWIKVLWLMNISCSGQWFPHSCVFVCLCMCMCVCARLCVFLSAACSVCKCTLKYMHCVFNPSSAALGDQIFCIHFLWYVNPPKFQLYGNHNAHMYVQSWCDVCLISF